MRARDAIQPTVTWRCAQAGLWIAGRTDGAAAGIIRERWTEGFHVTSATGRDLGTFPRLDDAKAALEHSEHLLRARTRSRAHPRF